jgi:cell division septum initiation protein DivIVA
MSVGGQVRGTADDEADKARFVTVMRGYDRIEVDEYVRDTRRSLQRLRAELADSEGRRRRAEEHAEAVEKEIRSVQAELDTRPAAPVEEGFGIRAERLLRIAEQEAAEIRSGASREAAATLQNSRAEAERTRHEAEQARIERESRFDEQVAQRTADLQQREQQIADQLEAARNEASAVENAARRAADQYRQRVQADAEEIVARARSEAWQIRDQAAQELSRLTGLQESVRGELARLATLLIQESGQPGREAAGRATGGEEKR